MKLITLKKISYAVLFALSVGSSAFAACPNVASTLMTVDSDQDGIPDPLESLENTQFCVKDNDVLNNNSLFIKQAYRDFLGREADAGGVSYWNSLFTNGTQNRAGIVQAFMATGEFQGKAAPITRLYKAYFNRMPDHEGLWYWVGLFGNGKTVADISQTFAQSPEFNAKYGSVANDAFIDLVYQNVLGRAGDADGRAYWLGLLDAGKQTRGEIMIGFSESAEHVSTTTNHLNLVLAYEGLLRRNVGATSYTEGMARLNTGTPISKIIAELIATDEYKARFIASVIPVRALNDTGATMCYKEGSNTLVSCTAALAVAFNSAQDGMLGRDVTDKDETDGRAGFSYTKIDAKGEALPATATSWACVKDNVTGLIWENKTDDGGLHDKDNIYTNYDNPNASQKGAYLEPTQDEIDAPTNSIGFVNAVNAEGLCGAKDWTRPTVDDLLTLTDYGKYESMINTNYFTNMETSSYFWTATPDRLNPELVYSIYDGYYVFDYYRSSPSFLRLVRSHKVAATEGRFEVYGNGDEILDKQTNLIWLRCPVVNTIWNGETCAASGVFHDFTQELAFNDIKALAVSTGKAWRLPSIVELQSLVVDRSKQSIMDPLFTFEDTYFWSSTPKASTLATDGSMAWLFDGSGPDAWLRSYGLSVMAVRSR